MVFEGSFYSVPHLYANQPVWIRATDKVVQFFSDIKLIKTHGRAAKKGTWSTDNLDYPESARKFLEQDAKYCLDTAKEVGNATEKLITAILTPGSLIGRRKAQALLRLRDTYGNQRLDNACRRALDFGNTTYEGVKNILVKDLDKAGIPKLKTVTTVELTKGAYLRPASEFAVIKEAC